MKTRRVVGVVVLVTIVAALVVIWWLSRGDVSPLIVAESASIKSRIDARCDAIESKLDGADAKLDRIESKLDRLLEMATPKFPDGMKQAESEE